MTEGQNELIEYWLQRAKESLEEARIMFETDHPHGCANRLYYACFYAVTALLLSKDLSSSKHSGVMALFNKHFVKTGIVSVEMGKFYSRLFEGRMESDYGDWVELETEITSEDFDLAQSFIDKIGEVIRV